MCSKESIGKMPLFQRNTSNTSLFRVFLATSYVKLQQAYISEAVAIGNWQIIGYKGPGEFKDSTSSATTNFTYQDNGSYTDSKAELGSSDVEGWAASNVAKLNDCTIAKNWTVKVKKATGSEGDATFTAATNCTDLTPNFSKIGG